MAARRSSMTWTDCLCDQAAAASLARISQAVSDLARMPWRMMEKFS